MDSSDSILLIILIALIALSAFFSSSETALTTVSRIKMRALSEDGDKRAARVLVRRRQLARRLNRQTATATRTCWTATIKFC